MLSTGRKLRRADPVSPPWSPPLGPLLPVHVAVQPVELVGDFGQVLIGAFLIFGAGTPVLDDFFFDFDKSFTMLTEKAGLPAVQFRP